MNELGTQFRDGTGSGRYPFGDDCSMTAKTGYRLPVEVFLDASIYPIGDYSGLRLVSVEVAPAYVQLTIGDADLEDVASVRFDPRSSPESLVLEDTYGRNAGILVVDTTAVATLGSWAAGKHVFDAAAARFVASCCFPSPATGVLALQMPDGELVTGDVWFKGDKGVAIVGFDGDAVLGNFWPPRALGSGDKTSVTTVVFNAVGQQLFERANCSGRDTPDGGDTGTYQTRRPLQKINNIYPDPYGRWSLPIIDPFGGRSVVRIDATGEHTVRFSVAAKKMGA